MKHDHSHEGEVNHTWDFPESLKARMAQVKKHLQENKGTYLVGASCLAAGYFLRKPSVIEILNETAPSIAPVFNNMPVISPVFNNTVNNVGHCCKIVQGLDDEGKLWPKAALLAEELAEEHGITFDAARTMLSKHLNGHSDHVFNKRYVTYGLGTTG